MKWKHTMAKKNKKPGKVRKSLGWAFKPFVNVTGWLGYNSVKDGYGNVKETVSDLFTTVEPEHDESFEEATKQSQENAMQMFKRRDKAHLDAAEKMKTLMSSPREMDNWMEDRRTYFNNLIAER